LFTGKTIINGNIIGIIDPIHAAVRVSKSVERRVPGIGCDCHSVIFDGRQGVMGGGRAVAEVDEFSFDALASVLVRKILAGSRSRTTSRSP
jgi:hypothetical protein